RLLVFPFELLFSFMFRFELLLRLVLRFMLVFAFATRLLLLVFVTFTIAKIRIASPIPRKTSTAPIPKSHGQTLRFCGAAGGIGDHGGCCGGGGGGGVDCPE